MGRNPGKHIMIVLTKKNHLDLDSKHMNEVCSYFCFAQSLKNLKRMDLSDSRSLKEIQISQTPLTSSHCFSSLLEIPSSIGNATSLKTLDLSCTSLVNLPSSICNATSLEKLVLSG